MSNFILAMANEVKENHLKVIILNAAKNVAIKNQNFLLAAQLRDLVKLLFG
jgi:protein-arginine kinase activator protein McsA